MIFGLGGTVFPYDLPVMMAFSDGSTIKIKSDVPIERSLEGIVFVNEDPPYIISLNPPLVPLR